MATWLFILFVLSVLIIWSFRTFYRKSFLKGRVPKQLDEIYTLVQGQISADVFKEVWSKVGEAFSIDPCLIEPSDTLKVLSSIDSWDLGKGEDALSQWIELEHLGNPPTLATVLDLAKWVEVARKNQLLKAHP